MLNKNIKLWELNQDQRELRFLRESLIVVKETTKTLQETPLL